MILWLHSKQIRICDKEEISRVFDLPHVVAYKFGQRTLSNPPTVELGIIFIFPLSIIHQPMFACVVVGLESMQTALENFVVLLHLEPQYE